MKRTISSQDLGLRSLFPVNPVSLYFANMRLAILSVSLISMVLICPVGLSQARDVATVKHSNPTASLKTIIVGDYYPYTFVNDKGVPDGFSVDVAKAVASVMDLNLDIRVDTWEHATRALSDGTIDMLPMMAYSPERDKIFDFSAPHTIAYDAVFSRGRAQKIRSLIDLNDKTIIVMNKDAAHQYLLASGLASKMKLILVDSLPDALRTLATGKGDAALMPKLVGMIIMKKLNLTNIDPSPVVIDAYNRPFSFAVKDGNQALLERLSQGLSIIKSTGQYKDIYNKWFGPLEPPALPWKTVIKYIAIIVAVFLVIALGLTVWTIFLRRQVALQTKHLVAEIQEHKRTEEAFTKSEAKYSSYVENAPDGVFIADEKGRYIEVNKAACLMTGFTEEELLQMSIPDLLSEESLEAGHAHFKALTETGVSKGELQYKHKDCSKRWWFVDAVKLSEARFLGFTKDVTERKHAEMELRQVTERFNVALYASKAGAWDWDIITGQVEWSSQMFNLFRLDPLRNKASFDTWKRALHPQDAEIASTRIDQALKQQAILNSDYRVLLPDGQIRWINAVGQGEYNEQGNPIRMTGICMDITERKQVEEELAKRESLLNKIFDVLPIGLWFADENGKLLRGNPAGVKIWGAEPTVSMEEYGTFKARRLPSGEEIAPDDWALAHTIKEGVAVLDELLEIDAFDGQKRVILNYTAPVLDDKGDLLGAIVVNNDITDRKQAEEEKRGLEERLNRAEKMESLGTLAGGVAHDLNNVLGIIVGYAEMLMDEMDEANPMRDDLEKILEGGNRSAAIVQDLLTLARRGVQTKKTVNMNAAIMDCQKLPEFEKVLSHNPQVKLQMDLESDLLNIMGSPVHIGKTIINLAANAVEAMPNGGVLKIATANQYLDVPIHGYDKIREGDYVVLTVSDTGEGIPERDIKRIFEPFYTKKIMGRSGTGLGLAVVWGTIKDHNGYINVESTEGKGTSFTLYFPVTREEIASDQVPVSMSEYMGRGETILVVDDINRQRELASRMLTKLNYIVKTVASGEEAIEYLKTNKADLIVLDMIMDPGIDGLETYENILKLNPLQKAVIVSGFSESDRVKEAQRIGAGAYVPKPYVLERLGMAVRKELDRK
jgi:two-component system, cell cycle sensor histidine kinase and response regulator CckA